MPEDGICPVDQVCEGSCEEPGLQHLPHLGGHREAGLLGGGLYQHPGNVLEVEEVMTVVPNWFAF